MRLFQWLSGFEYADNVAVYLSDSLAAMLMLACFACFIMAVALHGLSNRVRESEARDAKLETAIKDIYSKLGEVAPRIFAPKCPHYFYEHHAGNDNWRECHSCGYKQPL